MKTSFIIPFFAFSVFLRCALIAQNFSSQNITLLSHWNDTSVVPEPQHGIRYNGVFGWANPQDGKEYAIIGSTAGTYFIEITNPTQPVLRDFVAGRRDSCIWREIHAYQNYCYMVSDDQLPNSFQIVDMAYLPDSVTVVHDDTNIMTRCHTIYIDGNKLYGGSPKGAFGQSSMAVFNLNNPANPTLLRRLEEDFSGMDYTHDMFVRNDTIYASMSFSGYFAFIYDSIQNKFLQVGSLTSYPFQGYNHSSSLTSNGKYTIMCDEVGAGLPVKVVDVQDLTDMTVVATFQSNAGATPHNPYIIGNDRAVIAYYQDGVQIFDVSNPANPVRTGYFDTDTLHGLNDNYSSSDPYHGCWGAYTRLPSGNILASDMQNGLFVLDASEALGTEQSQILSRKSQISVYPNPNDGNFVISISGIQYPVFNIKILNLLGEVAYSQQILYPKPVVSSSALLTNHKAEESQILNLKLPSGIYFLQIATEKETMIQKLAVER